MNTNTIQIVDALKLGSYRDIREKLPNVKIVQVMHVLDELLTEVEKSDHLHHWTLKSP